MYTCSQCNNSTTNWLCSECLAQIFPFNHLDDSSFDLTSMLIDWKTFVLTVWIICILLAIVLILTQTVIFSKKVLVLVITFLKAS